MGMRHGACSLLSALSYVTLISVAYIIISRTVRILEHCLHICICIQYPFCDFQPTILSSGASKGPRMFTRHCRCTHQRELSDPKRIRLTIISTLRRVLLVGAMMKANRGILRNTLCWYVLLPRWRARRYYGRVRPRGQLTLTEPDQDLPSPPSTGFAAMDLFIREDFKPHYPLLVPH